MDNFGLYAIITHPNLSPEAIAQICVEQQISMLQVREKQMEDRELLALCRRLVSITRGSGTKLIVNDRPDIAYLSGADGVHLGQGDISLEDARKIVGEDAIIGLSTHSIKQAKSALALKPDYIGFGPVYKTTTKAIPDPVVGTELLREVLGFADVPVVAIGGITLENIDTVVGVGAKNICAVRPFMAADSSDSFVEVVEGFRSRM